MAAATLQPNAEKYLGRGFASQERIAQSAVVVGSRLGVGAAARGNQLPGEFVERLSVGNGLANPVVEGLYPFAIQLFLFVAQQIRPFQRPIVREFGPLQ